MAEHNATILWVCDAGEFLAGKYSREHTWSFDGGVTIAASSAPSSVPIPYSNPSCVDPEEAFVAALSSCHMLTYLYLAYRAGFQVGTYRDEAMGVTTRNENGVPWVSRVTLRPSIRYVGVSVPSSGEEERLHHLAHEQCFIANSVKTEVIVLGEWDSTYVASQ